MNPIPPDSAAPRTQGSFEGEPEKAPLPEICSFRSGPVQWRAAAPFMTFLTELFPRDADWAAVPPGAVVIKSGARRTVFSIRLEGFGGPVLVKLYRPESFADRLRDLLLRPQAVQEFEVALAFGKASLGVAEPLAAGRAWSGGLPDGSVLVTRFIEGARPVMDILKSGEDLSGLPQSTGAFFAALHEAGFYHPDLHLGNVLARRSEKGWDINLVDLHAVELKVHPDRARILQNLAHARNSHVAGNPRLFAAFMKSYAKSRGLTNAQKRALSREAWAAAEAMLADFYARRTLRCLKNSTGFRRTSSKGAAIFHRADADVEGCLEAVGEAARGGGRRLKDGERTRVSSGFQAGGRAVVVKEYLPDGVAGGLKSWFGRGRARTAWVGGNGLEARGIPAARPVLLAERAFGPSFVVLEDRSDLTELDRFLTRPEGAAFAVRKKLASALGRFIGGVHRKGVYHGDLKTCNILVEELPGRGFRFILLDHDRVVFGRDVPMRRKVKNLVQLNTSVPGTVSAAMRMRFLQAYVRACPGHGGVSALATNVLEGSTDRKVVYVTDDGDVIEPCKGGP